MCTQMGQGGTLLRKGRELWQLGQGMSKSKTSCQVSSEDTVDASNAVVYR